MDNYNGPFGDLNDYGDFSNMCHPIWDPAKVTTSSKVIYGPASTWNYDRSGGFQASCPPTPPYFKVLDRTYIDISGASAGMSETNPNVKPPVPPPFTNTGLGTPIQRGVLLGPNQLFYHSDHGHAGFYRITTPEYVEWRWMDNRWFWVGKQVAIGWTCFSMNVPYDGCPPGTTYNPQTGTCDVDDGWEWDQGANDGEGEYVPITPGVPVIPPVPPGILPEPDEPDLEPGDPIDCIVSGRDGCEIQEYITGDCDINTICIEPARENNNGIL